MSFKIPNEFSRDKSKSSTSGFILSPKPDSFGHTLIRYRKDLIQTNATTNIIMSTLDKFDKLIDLNESEHIRTIFLDKNQLLLVDNGRWLHGRTEILDFERKLVRIRFQAKSEDMTPWTI